MNPQTHRTVDNPIEHRIRVGRVAVRAQIDRFSQQFGKVTGWWKADNTRVTSGDLAISEQLFGEIHSHFPGDAFLSEESGARETVSKSDTRFGWVLDPIDGTNNYALGFRFCAISLALLLDGEPVYGFVYDHNSQALFEGGPGYALSKNRKRVDRDANAAKAQAMIGVHFPMTALQMKPIARLLGQCRARCFGSATLSATYVATGHLIGVIDYRVKVWDIAAAYALCGAVGVRWKFIGDSPFPLKSFQPDPATRSYYAGVRSFEEEISRRLKHPDSLE